MNSRECFVAEQEFWKSLGNSVADLPRAALMVLFGSTFVRDEQQRLREAVGTAVSRTELNEGE